MKLFAKSIVVSAVALALGLGASVTAQAQQFTMKLSSPTNNDLQIEWYKTFKAGVDARSGGRIKIEIYPANQLGQIPRTVEGVALGTIEVTMVASGFLVGLEPRYAVFDAVGLFDDMAHGSRVFADPDVQKRLSTYGASKGVEPLTTYVHSPNGLLTRKGVRALADIKGLKIRTTGTPMQAEPLKRLGGSPIPMPLGEVMPALQNGTIDGFFAGTTIFSALKFFDVAKTMTQLPQSWIVGGAIVNKAWMAALPTDLRAIVHEEARKADGITPTWGVEDIDKARKTWEQNGGQYVALSAAEQKRFVDEFTAATLPLLSANAQVKADYEAFVAAAKKHRK